MNQPTPAPPLERAARSLIKATADLDAAKRDLERAKDQLMRAGEVLDRAEKAMTAAAKSEPAAGFLYLAGTAGRGWVVRYQPDGTAEVSDARAVDAR